ncbi:hypothetical protein NG895_02080 [Aeoliella sp. ICT_H6.2]|uniref:Tyrosine specific protein phosphatases domain-containing protein n=1 Tax=Aeoliella straminimaris TaxID=2954799 RepID=A0A9X2F6I6_9BACT|nr:hypothetical protein [Aeoliella straminimaris]MCO6042684.1 hypothetical protein [Aeoliella straminimaris]
MNKSDCVVRDVRHANYQGFYRLREVTEVIVCSREHAEEFECSVPWACISIVSLGDERPEMSEENRVDLLELSFDDITKEHPQGRLFSDSDAADILDFVAANCRRARVVMVHCEEGVSRSSAVAAAVAQSLGLDAEPFLGGDYDPNQRVLSLLWERLAQVR